VVTIITIVITEKKVVEITNLKALGILHALECKFGIRRCKERLQKAYGMHTLI
jgi:hypothetical protein